MSTLSGVSSKGEKGKSKYQSLDINKVYLNSNKGDTSEQQQAKSTAPRKHGMLCLGKVPSTRRAPVNLPSLKSESSGSDPNVSLVPTGGTGWGSKSLEPPPPPITPTTPATSSVQTQGSNAPAVVGTPPVPQTNITPSPPQPPKPVVNIGGDKTWSSVMASGESGGSGPNIGIGGVNGPSFLAHQSPQFQAEFPSLPGEGGAPGPPPKAGEGGYGPGPSLRPQTEGSWAHGGGYQVPPPTHETQPPRPLTTQFPPPVPSANLIPQFAGVIPPFMLNNRSGGGSGGFPTSGFSSSNFQNSVRPPKFHNPPDNNRYNMNPPRPPPIAADSDEIVAPPIIRDEDLNRMDEISRDSGWTTQDYIDYNQKLDFSDEENTNDDEKYPKGISMNHVKDEKKDMDTEKESHDKVKLHDKISEWHGKSQPWQGRSSSSHSTVDMRSSLSRLSHANATRELDIDNDVWKEKQRQHVETVAAVAEKAKQRKEEEEKRFEETRSRSEIDKKKEYNEPEIDRKELGETFRQMTMIDRNFSRIESQQSFNRQLPPRFQKQQNIRHQQQNSSESRWGNQSFISNKQRHRNDIDDLKEKDDEKEKKERTPEPSEKHKERESEERDWDNRRIGASSAWEGSRHADDNKHSGRRDHNKKMNDNFKSHSSFDDKDNNDWREKPEIRERDRPVRPDSRDNRASRDYRAPREEPRTIQESVSNDYSSWAEPDYDIKDVQEEKVRRKENFKDDRREAQTHTRREGCVPGPITREKMEAYEYKHSMQAEKKELMGTSVENRLEGDSWKKVDQSSGTFWMEPDEPSHQQRPEQKQGTPQSQGSQNSANQNSLEKLSLLSTKPSDQGASSVPSDDKDEKKDKDDGGNDKKKDTGSSGSWGNNSFPAAKGSGNRGGRRGGSRSQYNSIYFRGSNSTPWSNKDSNRRYPSKLSNKGWNGSESECSGDEVSASTESGKEDKKTERKQTPRSPKSGERKKDKDDRNKESKKNESVDKNSSAGNTLNRKGGQQSSVNQSQSQQSSSQHQNSNSNQSSQASNQSQSSSQQSQQQQSGYESGGGGSGNRKEGFPPRGEPSRRGRGGPGRAPGGRGPAGAHYGPPGSKPAFPNVLSASNDQEANDSSSEEKKKSNVSGRKDQRKNDGEGGQPMSKVNKMKRGEQDEFDTTSDGSDSESKGKQRQNKKNMQRMGGDKRNVFGGGQVNGRPRSEEGKNDKSRLGKDDDDGSRFTNHSDIFHSNNGFQEVKSKKTGKDSRPLGKEDLKRVRSKEKGKGMQGGGNSKGTQGKPFQREWLNNKPPRMQRMAYLQHQQNQQQDTTVSDLNKINQNISMFPIRDASCPAPAPPPPVNAWEKPITPALRTTSPPSNLHHLSPSISNSQEKNVIEMNDRGPSGASSQTSSPSTDKALSKIARETVEKSFLDGSTPPVQTIVFENTNLKAGPEMALKNKYPQRGQRIEKGRDRKLEDELDGSTSPHMGLSSFKPGNEIKPGENKTQESIQMAMTFNKGEDNADMKLDFAFESDLSHLTDDKNNIPRSIHQVISQNPTADLDQKIASVKKVWETSMEHQHHDEVVSTSSSFTPNFGSAVNSSLDHSSAHQVDDSTFTSDVYASQNPTSNRFFLISSPQIQASATGFSSGGANMIKSDPGNPTSNVKPQPQPAAMSSAIGTHSGPSLSSPPPSFTQQGPFGYQTQYASNISAIPSPPASAVLISSAAAATAQQVQSQHGEQLFHHFAPVMSNQQGRSGYSQYPYGLSQSLGSGSAAFSQQNHLAYHLAAQPAAPNPEVYSSLNQFRLPPSAGYGQSQQLTNNPSTVLITSASNSLMSASVKSSPQAPPPLGAIGSKAGYQSSAHPTGVPLPLFPYEASMLPQSYLQSSPLVQRHGGNNVVPTIQPPTSFYSGSAGGQTTLFQPGNSILTGAGSQPAPLHSATFGVQGFSAQSANAPPSSNPVGVQSYSSPMNHFRGQTPTTYLKAGTNQVTSQHTADPKSPSTNQQDVMNCSVFSTSGGGQIPSPKSRSSGNSGGGAKQSQSSQQPSPTQAPPHHKFPYQQQNMVMQGGGSGNQQAGGGSGGSRGPPMPQGVRTGSNSGNGLNSNGVARCYPPPIQRPVGVGYQAMQQQRQKFPQPPRSQHQQHLKMTNSYYQSQANPVKLDVESKDVDKLQEVTNPANKTEKKEEPASNSEQ